MSNRNFDSRVIIQRLQDKNYARNIYTYNTSGNTVIHNPQNSDGTSSRYNRYHEGSETMYFRGLLGGNTTVDIGGTFGLPLKSSIIITPATPPTVPSAPIIQSISSGNTFLTVNFLPPTSNGGSPITTYEYSTNINPFSSINGTTSPFIISGLTNGTNYNVTLRAVNSVGSGGASNTVSGMPQIYGWITNIGGTGSDTGYGIATDIFGNVYTVGSFSLATTINNYSTVSSGIVITSSLGNLVGGGGNDAFITKYNSSGIAQWATSIGGTGSDIGYGIASDIFGNTYVTGVFATSAIVNSYSTLSSGTIITSTFGSLVGSGGNDAFIVKYNSSGVAQWGTNIGGTGADYGLSIATDIFGNVYTTGIFVTSALINNYNTISSGIISTTNASKLIGIGGNDVFIAKYNSSGISQWATSIGGTGADLGNGIATDIFGNVYTTGVFATSAIVNSYSTISSGVIVTSSFGTLIGAAGNDAFLVKYNSSGITQWATNVGGAGSDYGNAVKTDIFGNVYTNGYFNTSAVVNSYSTVSSGIIITSSIGSLNGVVGNTDTCIIKYNSSGIAQWATSIGGTASDVGYGIDIDTNGNIYATGYIVNSAVVNSYSTISSGTIITSTFGSLVGSGGNDAFIVKYNSSGITQWITNIGGVGADSGRGIATDINNNVYVTGAFATTSLINNYNTISSGIVTTTNAGALFGVGTDVFIVKYNSNGQA